MSKFGVARKQEFYLRGVRHFRGGGKYEQCRRHWGDNAKTMRAVFSKCMLSKSLTVCCTFCLWRSQWGRTELPPRAVAAIPTGFCKSFLTYFCAVESVLLRGTVIVWSMQIHWSVHVLRDRACVWCHDKASWCSLNKKARVFAKVYDITYPDALVDSKRSVKWWLFYCSFVRNWSCQVLKPRDKWVPVTTAWRVLRLRMEERPPDMEGSCEYIE
jgi:hypothetical protein